MKVLSWFYQVFASLHRTLYNSNYFKKFKISKPVLSIGNISMGGSGKTPLTAFLYSELIKQKCVPAIITKSYKAGLVKSQIVPMNADPSLYGDEAVFFKTLFPESIVISGPHKWESAKLAETLKEVDVVLLDDGFQHHRLFKNWNGVVVDLSNQQDSAFFRESKSALQYAQVLFCSRVELAGIQVYEDFKVQMAFDLPIFQIVNRLITFKNLASNESTLSFPFKSGLLVSAIGRPEQFHQMMKNQSPLVQFEIHNFEDHHPYTQQDVTLIESKAKELKLEQIFCTEKDWVKIQKFQLEPEFWTVVQLRAAVEPEQDWKNYFQKLCKDLEI